MIWTALLTTQMYSKGRHTQRCKKEQKDFDEKGQEWCDVNSVGNSTSVEQRTRGLLCEQRFINNSTNVEQRTSGPRCEQHCYK